LTTESVYKTAYLSFAVPLSGDLLSVQRDICRRYALLPRSEVHLTLAFFGENTARRLADLAVALLDDLPSWELARVGIDGLGGAYEITGGLELIGDVAPGDLNDCPRVLWLAATASDELSAFRGRAIEAARRVGVNTAAVGHDFFPHLTLGSAGPADRGSWDLWDVHTVPKRATIDPRLSLETLRVSKLHLTDVSIHPDSVHLLRAFPA
jgi:2'-5' RNA ligase